MNIYFYIPKKFWIEPTPRLSDLGTARWKAWGLYDWTVQTFLRLKEAGLKCTLCKELPEAGIIIFHRAAEMEDRAPNRKQYFVCIQADWGRSNFAHAHIVQNFEQSKTENLAWYFKYLTPGDSFFVHHWPQPGLICRTPSRKAELKSIYYFGLSCNLAPELRSIDWENFVKSLGLEWRVIEEPQKWADYSRSDAVLFCRDFNGNPHNHKPPTKLYNTWMAKSVPIFTPESAFLHEIKNTSDCYVLVKDYSDLKDKITTLSTDSSRYTKLLNRAAERGEAYSTEMITCEWGDIIDEIKTAYFEYRKQGYLKYIQFVLVRSILRIIRR